MCWLSAQSTFQRSRNLLEIQNSDVNFKRTTAVHSALLFSYLVLWIKSSRQCFYFEKVSNWTVFVFNATFPEVLLGSLARSNLFKRCVPAGACSATTPTPNAIANTTYLDRSPTPSPLRRHDNERPARQLGRPTGHHRQPRRPLPATELRRSRQQSEGFPTERLQRVEPIVWDQQQRRTADRGPAAATREWSIE
jgi:hypothetical protein